MMAANPLAAVASMVERIKAAYPASGPLMAIPDIAKLLIEATAPGQQWNSTKFQAELQGTDWWRNTPAPVRTWTTLKLTQPGEAARQTAQMGVNIHQIAGQE